VCCSVLQCKVQELMYTSMRRPYVCVAVCCRVSQCAAECRSALQCVTVLGMYVLQCVVVCYSLLQFVAV